MTSLTTGWLCKSLLAFLVIAAASCDDPRPALVRGYIAGVVGDKIIVTPLKSHSPARPLTLSMNMQNTTILARRVESGTMDLERADRNDLVVGREVAVTTQGHSASIIRVFPPKPVGGRVAAAHGASLTISIDDANSVDHKKCAEFWMNERTKILLETVDSVAPVHVSASELKLGRRVFVYAEGHEAEVVKIVPDPPVVGSVVRITAGSIVIRRAMKDGVEEDTAIPLQPILTRAIVQYYGTDLRSPASVADIKPGARAAVYVGDGGTVAIKFISTPLRGHLLAADAYSITFQSDGQSTRSRRFRLIPGRTVIMVPRPIGTVRRADGHSRTIFGSAAGSARDIRAGQLVLVSAADDLLYAVKVMPTSAASSNNSLPVFQSPSH